MTKNVYLKDWRIMNGDTVELLYSDNDTVNVSKADFDRAFGPIVSASKENVIRDFAI